MTDEYVYRPQEISYLGFLETQLRDMQGLATLVYELVQNADDVKGPAGEAGSRWIRFDVQDEALVVENDGVFRPVDFERLQTIAGGGKRAEAGTTGAFGLGFLAVYQVTDAPEIFSGGRHWTIHPQAAAGERIRERKAETAGTRLRLPWACDPDTPVRQALRLPVVDQDNLDEIARTIGRALELAALFLDQLTVLTASRNGRVVRRIAREVETDLTGRRLYLQDEAGHRDPWLLLEGEFAAAASELRERHPQIEAQRPAVIEVALPLAAVPAQGRLFAGLPTETVSPLPFHLHAGFFPTSDRRRVHLGEGYQAAWNEAALRAGARLLAQHLETVRRALAPAHFWQLVQQVAYTRTLATQGELPAIFATFWQAVGAQVGEMDSFYTVQERWITPAEGRVVEGELAEEEVALLRELALPVAHPALAPYGDLLRRELAVTPLAPADLIQALSRVGLTRTTPLYEATAFLNTLPAWQTFWRLFERLAGAHLGPAARAAERAQVAPVALILDEMMRLQRPDRVFRGDAEARALFPEIAWVHPQIPERGFPGRLVAAFGARQAVEHLAEMPPDQLEDAWRLGRLDLPRLFRWLEGQQIEIFADDPALQKEIRRLPLCPVAGELRPLAHLYIPGGFEDPLGVAGTVPLEAIGGRRQFLEDLGVAPLSFDAYLHRELPRVLEKRTDLPSDARHRLLRLLAERLGQFRDDESLQAQLSRLPLVPCLDGSFRAGEASYASRAAFTLLGEGTHVAEPAPDSAIGALYRWLGVRAEPAAAALRRRLSTLGEQVAAGATPSPETMATVNECWRRLQTYLTEGNGEAAALASLAEKPVIPTGPRRLARPAQLFLADDPALAAHFPALAERLVTPEAELAPVWVQAGVRPLAAAVEERVLSPAGSERAPALAARLAGRLPLIRRVLRAEGIAEEAADFVERLAVVTATPLQVTYRLAAGDDVLWSAPEARKAVLAQAEKRLYVAGGEPPAWAALAREVAQAVGGRRAPGGLALALKEVLAAESAGAAAGVLDELGYPP